VKDQLHGQRFDTREAIQKAVRQCLWMAGTEFLNSTECWEKFVQRNGDYVEK
jgi:hypothetical protein